MQTVNESDQRAEVEMEMPSLPSTQAEAERVAMLNTPASPTTEASTAPAADAEEDLATLSTPASPAAEASIAPAADSLVAEVEADEIRPPRKRKRTATKSARKERLPDPGDGSGYAAPYMPEGVDTPDEPLWYVIHCYSGYENKVKHNLEQFIESMGMADRILEVVVPTEDEIEVREGKRQTVERRVFPGYILVRMKMSEETWQVVRNTPGVTRFVGMGNRPQPLSQQEVDQIMQRMQAEAPKIKVNFRTGQKVRITDGPFADFMGIVDKIDTERAKVTVLVSFFGRETPVELDFLQVERM
jgi:transcriptional antiterminator NusG